MLNEKIDTSEGASELWFDPRRGSEKTFLRALGEIAGKSGHPELATVPWVLWGHSGGGIWADVMTALHPDRVIAAWLRSGSAAMFRTKPEFPQPEIPAALYGVPMMCNPGAKEQMKGPWIGTLATFQEYRLKGAPIGFAPDPRTGHECGDSRYLAIPFLDACLAMRLPEKGSRDQALKPVDMSQSWLAALESADCHPQSEFKGNPNAAVWLPNAAVAKAWAEYVKTGAVERHHSAAVADARARHFQRRAGDGNHLGSGGGFRERHRLLYRAARRPGAGESAGEAGGQVWTAAFSKHDVSRHARPALAGIALLGSLGESRRDPRLCGGHGK